MSLAKPLLSDTAITAGSDTLCARDRTIFSLSVSVYPPPHLSSLPIPHSSASVDRSRNHLRSDVLSPLNTRIIAEKAQLRPHLPLPFPSLRMYGRHYTNS
jgi:hypothetical protein